MRRGRFSVLVQGSLQLRRENTDKLLAKLDFLKSLSAGDRGRLADAIQCAAWDLCIYESYVDFDPNVMLNPGNRLDSQSISDEPIGLTWIRLVGRCHTP